MIRRFALCAALALALGPRASAEVLELEDGSRVEAAYVGEDQGQVIVLLPGGKEASYPRGEVTRIDWSHTVSDKLRRKAERAREKLLKRQRREVQRLLRRYGRAKPQQQGEIGAALAGYSAEALLEPLSDALSDTRAPTRALALERLAALQTPKAVGPLVRATLASKHAELREGAHVAALKVDPTLARRFYETVASSRTKPIRRLRAFQRLEGMGERDAVPGLVRALEQVRSELRTTLATSKGSRSVPLNLGTRGGAAIDAPVELPEASLTEVQTSAVVSVATLRRLRGAAVAALEASSGQKLGDDPAAWRRWWDRQPKDAARPETARDD
jgi:hypothetical protein